MRAAFVTPTIGRQHLHPQLHHVFREQTLTQRGAARLYVLDESTEPSPFFSRLKDAAVTYVHRIAKPRIDGVTRIGETRNDLNAMVREECILHLDDDDALQPTYGEFMLSKLGDADLCKLDVFNLIHEATGILFQWDTREAGGTHWAILGDQIKKVLVAADEMDPELVEDIQRWFGFSLVYPKKTWERHPFPVEGTEDIAFVKAVEGAGGRVVYVHDGAHLILHAIGSSLSQHAYPQRLLGAAKAAEGLRAEVGKRMLGAMGAMEELPSGQTIQIVPGVRYQVLAAVSDRYSLRGLSMHAASKGVTLENVRDNVSPSEFGVPAPEEGLRLVHVEGSSSKPAKLPWKAPGFLGAFEKSHVVKAWTSAPLGAGMARESGLLLGVDRGPLGAGAGAGPPGFTALLQGEPAANSAWNQVQAQLSAEGNTDTYDAQSDFLSAYGQLAYTTTQTDPTTIANAAGQFVIMGRTVAGAVSGVGGLLAAAASGSMTPQAAGQFTGMLVSGATSLAISTGIVTAGVGAAIVAGVTLAIDLLETLFPNNVVTQVGACGLSSKPNILVGSVWSQSGLVVAAGPGPKSIYWRRFPNPQNSADSAWFALPQPPSNQAGGFQWTSGASTDTWQPCSMNMPGGRNIDLAWPTYRQLECEAAAADGSPFAQFQLAFFAAWKASQEYALNGLYAQPDYQVLLQTLRFWNAAHSSSSTMQLQARSGSPISPTVGFAFNATLSPCSSSIVPYASLLVSQIATSAASDPNYNAAANAIVINTGPLLQPVIASDLVSQTVVPQLPNAIFPGASTAKMTTYAFGIPAALAVSAAAYGYFVKKDVWYVFKAAGGALKDGGQTLAGAHVPGLGAAERRSKRYERCVRKVKKRGSAVNPWAVCTKSVGR